MVCLRLAVKGRSRDGDCFIRVRVRGPVMPGDNCSRQRQSRYPLCTVTNLTFRHPRAFDDCNWSSHHHELCHRSRGSTSCPGRATCRCVQVFSLFLLTALSKWQQLTHKEEVEGAETHEMDTDGSHASSVTSSLPSVSTGQDTNDEAQSVVPQPEGVTSISI
jgi:hypothetical protein